MPLSLRSGVDLLVEVALTTAVSGFAIWDGSVFDGAFWGPDEVWVDVSADVRKLQITRGFSDDLRTWTAGTIEVTLSNLLGQYSPDNTVTGAPYATAGVSSLLPGLPIRVSLIYASVTYPRFKGWVRKFAEGWTAPEGPRSGDAWVTLSGDDAWARLSAKKGSAVAAFGAGQTLGPRISAILDSAGFTGPRDLNSGSIPFQATTLADDPVQEIAKVCAGEGGSVYIGPSGEAIARDRYSLVEDYRSTTVMATFGDGGGVEIPWETIDVVPLDDTDIVNYAEYSRVGGTVQTATDPTSIAIYGYRSDRNDNTTDLPCQNDSDVLVLAQWAVALRKNPEARIGRLSIRPWCNPTILIPIVLSLDMRDLVQIVRRPPSAQNHTMTRFCFINGMTLTIDNGDMVIEYTFAPASVHRQYATSRFDEGTFGSSESDTEAARFFV